MADPRRRKSRATPRWRGVAATTAHLVRRAGWRRSLIVTVLLCAFASGFYIAQLYSQISALIEERHAALTSSIYSAPLEIRPGDEVAQLHLISRLDHLGYTRVENPTHPGQYSMVPGAMTIYVRDFSTGSHGFPATLVHLNFSGSRVLGIADSFGVGMPAAMIEPEVVARLMPDAPAQRVEVSLNEMPPYLTKGLLATEDRFFYYHFGFDPVRIIEAAILDFHAHHLRQGASTITQQLARTFIEKHTRTFSRKFRELSIALVLEMRLTKNEILERYINDVPMGDYDGAPIYGLPLAARYFFNKDLREVTPAEAATLIGMIQAPTLYSPVRHADACRTRRGVVLAVMLHAHVLDQAQYADATAQPVVVVKAPGLRRAPYFADYVRSLVEKLPGFDGNLKGVRVYTTLDPEMQEEAQQSVVDNLKRLEHDHPHLRRRGADDRLESSLVALDPRTGAIVAMVGGRDYSSSQFNRAANAERQVGSAFKPVVYATALDPEWSPLSQPVTLASILPDRPMSFGGWAPANYERTYHGQVTVAEALAESLNVPTAYLGSLLGPPAIIRTAHHMGISEDLPNYLPISIGAGDMTLVELTSVYQVFASGGVQRPPYAIEAVIDGRGRVIYEHRPEAQRLMSRAISYIMTGALQGVLQWGTGAGAARMGLDFPAAGKTGTTDDYRDAYFIGYTPTLVCGVWVGFDKPQSIGFPAATAALPAWVHFMANSVREPSLGFGPPPPGITMATIDPATGGLATPSCPRVANLPFLDGTEPTQMCPLHGGLFASTTPAIAGAIPGAPAPPALPGIAGAPSPPNASGTASNSLLGAVSNFFGSLFGH